MIRILFLEHNTDGTVGGSHYCLLEICRALDRSRFEAVVWFHQRHALVPEFVKAGCEVVIEPAQPPHTFASRTRAPMLRAALSPLQKFANAYSTLVLNVVRWKREMRERRIDIVHLNNSCTYDHELALAAQNEGIPCIAHQRGFPPSVGRFDRWVARRMSLVIAISTAIRDDLQKSGILSTLLHDAIDPTRVSVTIPEAELRVRHGIPAGAPVVGIVGNVKRWKGQDVVVAAMRTIVRAFPDTHCVIIGAVADVAYQSQLERDAAAHGLAGSVHFLGYQRHPADWMAMMDVVLHASVEPEPFGIVLLEAMALGKPVIATDFGGPRDIVVDGETGFRVPMRDPDSLAARVTELLGDAALRARQGAAGRRRLEDQFTIAAQVRTIEQLYLNLHSSGTRLKVA